MPLGAAAVQQVPADRQNYDAHGHRDPDNEARSPPFPPLPL